MADNKQKKPDKRMFYGGIFDCLDKIRLINERDILWSILSGSQRIRGLYYAIFLLWLLDGAAVLAGIAGYGLYGIQKRNIRLSLYLINIRLAAQGTFVGILTVGSAVLLYQRLTGSSEPEKFSITKR